MLTTEQLLIPRVVVENLWPGCDFEVGEILLCQPDGDYISVNGFYMLPKEEVEPFPYLMRPLAWWQERDEKDMPQYLKYQSNPYPEIFPVFKHKGWMKEAGVWFYKLEGRWVKLGNDFTPATEAEYIEFLNNKK